MFTGIETGTRGHGWAIATLLIGASVGIAGCHVGDLVHSTGPDSSATDPDTAGSNPALQATHLIFEVPPSDVAAGDTIRPTVRVVARNEEGETAAEFTGEITVAITSGAESGSLSGELVREAVNGVAAFDDLAIDRAAAAYSLSATAAALDDAVSPPFLVAPAAPDAVELIAGNGQADSVAATVQQPYVIRVVDRYGNPVPATPVAWTVVRGEGSVASEDSRTDGAGSASAIHTFGTAAGDQVVVAAVVGVPGATVTFVSHARPGQPAVLEIAREPTSTPAGDIITPPVVVRILDQFGNDATQVEDPVSVAIAPFTGTPLAQLSGTLFRTPVDGVVTFDDLSISLTGFGYRLRFTIEGLSRDSRAFNVY